MTNIDEMIIKLQPLGDITVGFSEKHKFYTVKMNHVFGKPSYSHAISPIYHASSIEIAMKDYYNFLLGCEAIFVDKEEITEVFYPCEKDFVFSTSYRNKVVN